MRHKKILKERAAAGEGASNAPAASGDSTSTAPAASGATGKASGDGEPGTDSFDPNDPPKPLD